MTDTPTKIIVDIARGETKIVPLTAEEIAQREADAQAAAERKAQEDADAAIETGLKESAKAKLLAAGLSEAEVAVLIK